MPQWPNIYDEIIKDIYQSGRVHLRVLSGYGSSAFVHHVLHRFENVTIDLILGMAKKHPLMIWEHNEFVKLVRTTGRLRVRYYIGDPPIHSKVILWTGEEDELDIAYAGSSNFTWNGFRDYRELMIPADPEEAIRSFPDDNELIDCTDARVFDHIRMSYQGEREASGIDTTAVSSAVSECPSVVLKLTQRNNEVHEKSGLNWGQRVGREPNQAYLPVPLEIHRNNPDFFPPLATEFILITDDGESFICSMAQQGRKAIHTTHDNSLLGKYFRRRLGVPLGEKVNKEHLIRYGRDYVTIYKMDNDAYYMDFS